MTEEPYRWLEAIANRREYVREQLKGGSPAFGVALQSGVLLFGVGTGQSKVFELFDRQAMTGLGHPADLERLRQAAIDAAHLEAFTRAPEDVSLRRLVSFGLSGQLKTSFEQVYAAPFLLELLLVEVGATREEDTLLRLHFDGAYQFQAGQVAVVASDSAVEEPTRVWLSKRLDESASPRAAVPTLLFAWRCLTENTPLPAEGEAAEVDPGWRKSLLESGKVLEIGWLERQASRRARYRSLGLADVGW